MSAGEIGHDNIIQMHDIGRDVTGAIYLVMEMLKGESLAERVRREGAMPVQIAVDVMLQTLDALDASHRKGIVHRDMKPENIFLCRLGGRDDYVKLLDFGIAKVKEPADGQNLTRTGTMMGTSYYMAPEQISGDREADHRMDIYACGVILYQMLVGHVPFDATSVHGIIYKIMNEEPPPLGTQRSDVPLALEDVVRRAMARNRDHRYQAAADFAMAIQQWGSGRIVFGRGSMTPAKPLTGAMAAGAAGAAQTVTPVPSTVTPATGTGTPVPSAQATGTGTQTSGPVFVAAQPQAPVYVVPQTGMPAPSVKAAPPNAAAPAPKKRSGFLWAILVVLGLLGVGGVIVLAMGLVGGALIFKGQSDDRHGSADASVAGDPAGQGPTLYRVRVKTVPPDAKIYVGEEFKGTAPLTLEVPLGKVAVTAKRAGYPVTTVACDVEDVNLNECEVDLSPGAVADAAVAVDAAQADSAAPVDAQVDPAVDSVAVDPAAAGDAAEAEPAAPIKKKPVKPKCDPKKNPKCMFIQKGK